MEEIIKTGYDWCLEKKIRITNLENWKSNGINISYEDSYFLDKISEENFNEKIKGCRIKENSNPRKTEKFLELRMYTLVPYNLLGIQKGIQHEHATTSYVVSHVLNNFTDERYNRWATEWKTSILLNGGTSNEGHIVRQGFKDELYVGSMQKHLAKLKENGIKVSTFYEPDLNSMLTGISFLVDERVFDKELYPNYVNTPYPWGSNYVPTPAEHVKWIETNANNYEKWCERIGGKENVFLREFLLPLKLA